MKRVYTLILIVILVPLLLFGGLFFLLANPAYYKPTLISTFKQQTGFDLAIDGAIHWRYWPPVALSINDVKVSPPGATTPLASINSASVSLQLWPLLMGQSVTVDAVSVDGMTINALVNKAGHANWQPPGGHTSAPARPKATQPAAAPSKPGSGTGGLALDVQSIDITNSTIHYQDETAGANYTLSVPLIHTGVMHYNTNVPVNFNMYADDQTGGIHASLDGRGYVKFDQGFKHIGFSRLEMHPSLTLPGLKNITARLRLVGSYDVAAGKFTTNLDGSINSTDVKGTLGATLGKVTGVNFNLDMNQLIAGDFLPKTAASNSAGKARSGPPADVTILPLGLLNSLDLNGKLAIGKLQYAPWTFKSATLTVTNRDQRLELDTSVQGYGGTARVDFVGSSQGQGAGHTTVDVKGIDITKLTGFKSVTGKIQLNSNTTFTGHKLSSILNSLDGTTTFDITGGTLDVTPIKNIAQVVDALRGKGNSGIANWPDKMPFDHLTGMHRFINGTGANQQFNFTAANLNVTGRGGFDYFKDHLSYDLTVSLNQTTSGPFTVSSSIAGVKWPLHCEGTFSESPAKMCRPDKQGIQKAVEQILKQKGENVIRQKLEDKLKGLFGH